MGDAAQRVLERVRATIAKYRMLADGEAVVAAVSGGPDSMCLLHVLVALGHRIHVAHFDHRTRGRGSAEDAEFTREATARLGLP
ncbi:MAG: tRNA(Ile)-lysidine synthetase, partial [Candidatus Hydrogenedentes bacterium]|nr:tRNA(Ile)-lysidine synthetase [Candidatus Hydrogenedentota bacterium]